MIKTFEQFVAAKYGKPVNEGFQSNVLRDIIKQHGLPKREMDKKMLYDLKDDEIVDVVDSREEYYEKYPSRSDSNNSNIRKKYGVEEATFMIELEDGACVVISNLDILKDYSFYKKDEESERNRIFKERHAERHKGNLGKHGGDDIHKKHLEKVDELESKRLAAKLQPNIPEIVEKVYNSARCHMNSDDWLDQRFVEVMLGALQDTVAALHEQTVIGGDIGLTLGGIHDQNIGPAGSPA